MSNRFSPCMIELHKLAAQQGDNDGLIPAMLELFQRPEKSSPDTDNVVPFENERAALKTKLNRTLNQQKD